MGPDWAGAVWFVGTRLCLLARRALPQPSNEPSGVPPRAGFMALTGGAAGNGSRRDSRSCSPVLAMSWRLCVLAFLSSDSRTSRLAPAAPPVANLADRDLDTPLPLAISWCLCVLVVETSGSRALPIALASPAVGSAVTIPRTPVSLCPLCGLCASVFAATLTFVKPGTHTPRGSLPTVRRHTAFPWGCPARSAGLRAHP